MLIIHIISRIDQKNIKSQILKINYNKKTEKYMTTAQKQNQHDLKDIQQQNNILKVFANSIVNKFENLYEHIQEMKQNAIDQLQILMLKKMQKKVDNLAEKTLNQNQNKDMKVTAKRNDVQKEIQNLKLQLELMQKKHDQLQQKHEQLQNRVTDIECNMVNKQQFEQLKSSCQERFQMFDSRFKVIQDQNQKLFIYADEDFKRRIKPSQQFKQKLTELMNTNYRLFQYGKKMYWSLINQILAYRALSTGLVQKGQIKQKYQQLGLFKQVLNAVNVATYLIAGIPFVNSAFMIVKDLACIFFEKRQEVVVQNMRLRVQGYFTQDQIAQDVARAVLDLLNNPYIQVRIAQFQTKSMIVNALSRFFQFIANNTQITAQLLANKFFSKLCKFKSDKQSKQSKYINENVMIDTSLVMWKMAQNRPAQKRYAVSEAVKSLFSKDIPKQVQYCQRNNLSPLKTNFYGNPILPSTKSQNVQQTKFLIESNQNNYMKNSQKMTQASENGSSSKKSIQNLYEGKFQQYANNRQSLPIQKSITTSQYSQTRPYFDRFSASNISSSNISQRGKYFKLKIFKAELTLKRQLFGKLNLYCIAKYGNKLVKTQPLKSADLKPVWNQQFIFQAKQIPSTITLQLYDKERVMKDSFIGSCVILDGQIDLREQQIQLWNQGRSIGKLCICLHP